MDVSEASVIEFIYQSAWEGFALFMAISVLFWPVGAARKWVAKMME